MSSLLKAAHITLGMDRKSLHAPAITFADTSDKLSVNAERHIDANERDAATIINELKQHLVDAQANYATAIAENETQVTAAFQRGWREGHLQGKADGAAEVESKQEEQLVLLKAAIGESAIAVDRQLAQIEPLALTITQAILDKIFGDPSMYAALVIKTARHHLSSVVADSAIRLEVSGQDFPDPDTLKSALGGLANKMNFTISTSPSLPHGACFIQLKLGRLDVSLQRQTNIVKTTLAALDD